MKELRITRAEENQRLDKFLLKYMNKANKSFVYQMLRKKRIKLNGGKASGSEILKQDDLLRFYLAEETMLSFMSAKPLQKAQRHFGIIYEDDNVLFVAKPAGLLTHPETSDQKDTLIDQVLYYMHEKGQYTPDKTSTFTPALCNRLDRNTSGIILVGKTLKGVQGLNEILRERAVDKFYTTVVSGKVTEKGEINNYLSKDEGKNQVRVHESNDVAVDAVQALTKYRPIAHNNDFSLLEIQLITGKTHQIRVHLESINHPIIGDRKYGDISINKDFKIEYGLNNQFLHGEKVKFHHDLPALVYLKGKTFTAPFSPTFDNIINDLFPNLNEDSE